MGGEPVPEADSIVLGLTPVLPVSDRTDAAGEEDGFYVYSELGFRLVWGGIAVYLDFGVDIVPETNNHNQYIDLIAGVTGATS